MDAKFEIKVTKSEMYNFMLYHSYHSFSGIFSIAAGAVLLGIFAWDQMGGGQNSLLYLFFGVLFLVYQPWALFMGAAKQVGLNPAFKNPFAYEVSESGITVRQGEAADTAGWESVWKVRETSKSILVYTSKKNAFIWAKKQMGDQEAPVRRLLAAHVPEKQRRLKRSSAMEESGYGN